MQCLNPECENDVDVVGVCVSCANSGYYAREDGAEIGGDTENPINTREDKLEEKKPDRRPKGYGRRGNRGNDSGNESNKPQEPNTPKTLDGPGM